VRRRRLPCGVVCVRAVEVVMRGMVGATRGREIFAATAVLMIALRGGQNVEYGVE
jgi:hypothetical protein